MDELRAGFARLGVEVPAVYLPSRGIDYSRWAVVACDQYSSEKKYWQEVSELVGERPSTLKLIYPEAYLNEADKADRIARIQKTMNEYLAAGTIESMGRGFVLVERHTPFGDRARVGLVMAVDLDRYEYGKDSHSLIRPTEGTIVERLPPRMQIRRGAPLELPHIMLLIDDPARSVIEPLYAARSGLKKLYDFDLMKNSGHIRGWQVAGQKDLSTVLKALEKIADPAAFEKKYNSRNPLLFAVGDGNHSLATAKAIWEEIKSKLPADSDLRETHPARYALVELINIYDEGLPFHPIHRVLFNTDEGELIETIRAANPKGSETRSSISFMSCKDSAEVRKAVNASSADVHRVGLFSGTKSGYLEFRNPTAKLAVGTIQPVLDAFLKSHPKAGIDYIHGDESVEKLGREKGNIGLYLPPVDKSSFFGTIVHDGVMPRKTFSMGEAPEKRFYIEARRIMPE